MPSVIYVKLYKIDQFDKVGQYSIHPLYIYLSCVGEGRAKGAT